MTDPNLPPPADGRDGAAADGAGSYRREPLTSRERLVAVLAAVLPVPLAALVLLPFAAFGPAGPADVVVAALVYGGLLGLAGGVVAVDLAHARRCPRCGRRNPRGLRACATCGYDLVERPRYACDQRHELYLRDGRCACGRRLQRLPAARGVGREVAMMIKIGAGLLAFLVAVALLLRLVG